MKKMAAAAVGVLAAIGSLAASSSTVSIGNQGPHNDIENMTQTNQTEAQGQTETAASAQAEEQTQPQERPSDNQKMDIDEQGKTEPKEYNFIEIIGAIDGQIVYGTPGNDSIKVTAENRDYYVEVFAGAGNDIVICEIGNCHVDGGPGNDTIFLNDGTSNGSTFADGADGNDYLYGNDIHGLHGGEGDDVLERGDGMEGGPGADLFICKEGGPGESGSWVIDYRSAEVDTVEANCTDAHGQPLGQ
jgi:Ca2+-binding RTX toxin-like protein